MIRLSRIQYSRNYQHQSVLPKGRTFTANSGTKAAFLTKGRSPIRRRSGERHLPECIRLRRPHLSLRGVVTLVFLQDKVNNSRYIAQVVNLVLLPFLRQEGDVLFQQDNARQHKAAAT